MKFKDWLESHQSLQKTSDDAKDNLKNHEDALLDLVVEFFENYKVDYQECASCGLTIYGYNDDGLMFVSFCTWDCPPKYTQLSSEIIDILLGRTP